MLRCRSQIQLQASQPGAVAQHQMLSRNGGVGVGPLLQASQRFPGNGAESNPIDRFRMQKL